MFARKGPCRGSCIYQRVKLPLCRSPCTASLYRCCKCDRYHVCDGGIECAPICAGEDLLCSLTGSAVGDNIQDGVFRPSQPDRDSEVPTAATLGAIIACVQADIASFFARRPDLADVARVVLDHNGSLQPSVSYGIERTFEHCRRLLETTNAGYDLICSMYAHVIISIYSERTVYGSLLFKCTKNKRCDPVVKRIREEWMSTLITGDCGDAFGT